MVGGVEGRRNSLWHSLWNVWNRALIPKARGDHVAEVRARVVASVTVALLVVVPLAAVAFPLLVLPEYRLLASTFPYVGVALMAVFVVVLHLNRQGRSRLAGAILVLAMNGASWISALAYWGATGRLDVFAAHILPILVAAFVLRPRWTGLLIAANTLMFVGVVVVDPALRLGGFLVPMTLFLLGAVLVGIGSTVRWHDLRRIQHQERDLRHRTERVVALEAMVDRFAFAAAHHLQEPLRQVNIAIQRIERDLGPESPVADHVEEAEAGVEDLRHHVRSIGEFVGHGIARGELVEVDLENVVDRTLEALHPVLEAHGAQVHRGELPHVRGDPVSLGLVFAHLLGNALRYHGGRPVRVHVEAERRGAEWEVRFRDEGPGIPVPYREHVFEPFRRLHGPREVRGTGLGLTLARRIVEEHGGRIWVADTETGAEFRFTLPAGGEGSDGEENPVVMVFSTRPTRSAEPE